MYSTNGSPIKPQMKPQCAGASSYPPRACHASAGKSPRWGSQHEHAGRDDVSGMTLWWRRGLRPESLAIRRALRAVMLQIVTLVNILQLNPHVFVQPDSSRLKASQATTGTQTALVVFGISCRGYHHQVDRVRRVEPGEGFMTATFQEYVQQRVGDSSIEHQCNKGDGDNHVPPYRRPAVPSHGCNLLVAAHGDPCLDRNIAWVHRKCGSEELWCGSG